MLILSQRKTSLVPMKNVVVTVDGDSIFYVQNGTLYEHGYYKNNERVREQM